jgi:hypothetical protein
MAIGSFYQNWNFTDNPFSAMPLKADAAGNKLLIGREDELRKVLFRLKAGGSAVCLDGPIGVGKTSLSNVASFRAEKDYLDNSNTSPLLISCRTTFQIDKNELPENFRLRILTEVAQTLIEKATSLQIGLRMNRSTALDKWLNSPLLGQIQAQIPAFGLGGGFQTNESAGFTNNGLIKLVTQWLESIFPDDQTGGVICVIDNLELLETSSVARRTIESLRDTLFTIKGIRWILCGAHGIINSVVASPRLVGHLGQPLEIKPLQLTKAQDVFNARVFAFKDHAHPTQYLPLIEDDFHKLYLIVNRNLRQSLAYSNEYCLNIAEVGQSPVSNTEKSERFNSWLKKRAEEIKFDVKSQLTPRARQFFADSVAKMQGEFSPSDYEQLGFNSLPAMRPYVKSLEEVGLLQGEKDDGDQRRKTISVTGKGWLLNWVEVTH